jgi:predicted small lipoprotein YifL
MAYSVSALTTLNLHMKRIKRRVKIQLFLVAMMIFLAACGQRGPLYLPEPEQEPINKNEINAGEINADEIDEDEIYDDEIDEDETGDDPG